MGSGSSSCWGFGLLPRVALDMLGGARAVLRAPFMVIVDFGVVLHELSEIAPPAEPVDAPAGAARRRKHRPRQPPIHPPNTSSGRWRPAQPQRAVACQSRRRQAGFAWEGEARTCPPAPASFWTDALNRQSAVNASGAATMHAYGRERPASKAQTGWRCLGCADCQS